MKKLTATEENTPQVTDEQFKEIWTGKLGGVDETRFRTLLAKYRGGSILDVGCFDSPIPIWYEQAVGVDFAPEMIDVLSKRYPNANYVCSDVFDLDGKYDYIVAGEILEHMKKPRKFAEKLLSLLNDGGVIAISTPYREGDRRGPVSGQHEFSWGKGDIAELFAPHKVSETVVKSPFEIIIAYVEKGRVSS